VTFDKLISWPDSPDAGIKYFSGTATYRKTLSIPSNLLGSGRRLYLDLGDVQVIARLSLNGKDLGILWKPPIAPRSPSPPIRATTISKFKSPTSGQTASSATNNCPRTAIATRVAPLNPGPSGSATASPVPPDASPSPPSVTGKSPIRSSPPASSARSRSGLPSNCRFPEHRARRSNFWVRALLFFRYGPCYNAKVGRQSPDIIGIPRVFPGSWRPVPKSPRK